MRHLQLLLHCRAAWRAFRSRSAVYLSLYFFYQDTHLRISHSATALTNLSRAYVCVCLLAPCLKQVHDQAARAWCVAVAFECAGKYAPPGWREHISRGHARRVRGLSCDREASRTLTDRTVTVAHVCTPCRPRSRSTLFFGPEPRLASLNPETVKVHESCLGLSRVRPYARAIHV